VARLARHTLVRVSSALCADETEPRLEPMTLYEYLLEKYPGQYERVLRTLQRRVESWKAIYGDPQAVMFEIRHEPGEMGLSDFHGTQGGREHDEWPAV